MTPPSRKPTVLVVDDVRANRVAIASCLDSLECTIREAVSGEEALEHFETTGPDLVLLDVRMPGCDGFETCRRIKSAPGFELTPVVMVTAAGDLADRVAALEAGADDLLTKPVDRVELVARVRSALRLKAILDKLERAEQVIFSLAAAVEAKDAYTGPHTHRVGECARRLGERAGLESGQLDALHLGGLVHDIGKIGVPDSILLKPGPLGEEEKAVMQRHPVIGAEIVGPLDSAAELVPIIRHHHENFDGTGYPDGLAGDEIPLLSRIVAVCDAFDAMTSHRPYRPARSRSEAINVLRGGSGRQWDAELVALLAEGA